MTWAGGLAELFPVARNTKTLSKGPLCLDSCREMLPAPRTEGRGMSSYRRELFLFPTLMWAQELSGPPNPNNTEGRGKWEGLPHEGSGKI